MAGPWAGVLGVALAAKGRVALSWSVPRPAVGQGSSDLLTFLKLHDSGAAYSGHGEAFLMTCDDSERPQQPQQPRRTHARARRHRRSYRRSDPPQLPPGPPYPDPRPPQVSEAIIQRKNRVVRPSRVEIPISVWTGAKVEINFIIPQKKIQRVL